ncbi:hypothetical protein GDO86_015857 [Hymenochirus boettgeri]|uniref:WW domain-containing protein n=1 Tax=Hymenochirus boettgeri TaxID=247094 RepID=A0A8T2K324_9PIPI|nr:hypothetical protein GDO86_015857 [Hymenochirus boettgeri]
MIRCLKEEVQHSLRSGITINSISQCVEELVLNGIDAHSTCIAVRIDLETFKIQVVDNGCGLYNEDMERVGMRYFTSKCHSLKDLENAKFHGFRGEAIASIAEISSIVEITSKCMNTARTFKKIIQNGKLLQGQESEINRPSVGTTVTVYNLFYNLPVRRKYLNRDIEFENIRQRLELLSLLHPSISLSLKNDSMNSVILQLPKTKDVRSRFCQIYGLSKSQKLYEIQHNLEGFDMWGFISTESHYNKTMQHIYVNKRLVLKTKLHHKIDYILRKESMICRPKNSLVRKHISSPGRNRSCQELYGIFVVDIQCNYSEYDVYLEPSKTLIEFRDWDTVLLCIEEGTKNFLKKAELYIESTKEDTLESNSSPCKDFQEGKKQDVELFQNACCNMIEHFDISNLKSKLVHRSNADNYHESDCNCNVSNDANKKTDASSECSSNKKQFSVSYSVNEFNVEPSTTSGKDNVNKCYIDNLSPAECLTSASCIHSGAEIQKGTCAILKNENSVLGQQTAECTVAQKGGTLCGSMNSLITVDKDPLIWNSASETPGDKISIFKDLAAKNMGGSEHNDHVHLSLVTEASITNKLFKLFSRPGPAGAKEIFKNKTYESHHKANVNSDITLSLCSKRRSEENHPKVKYKAVNQLNSKKLQKRTLSLGLQTESLEKFRQSYGKLQNFNSNRTFHPNQLNLNEPQCSSTLCNQTVKENITLANDKASLPENPLRSEGLGNCDQPRLKEIPMTQCDYEMLQKDKSNTNNITCSLAAKLCKMKQKQTAISHLERANSKECVSVSLNEQTIAQETDQTTNIKNIMEDAAKGFSNVSTAPVISRKPANCFESSSSEDKLTATSAYCSSQDLDGFMSDDWICYYEESLGRNVFINRATGLSSYIHPMQDRNAICRKDLTTTAVTIVCRNGFQYQCHPFRSEIILPFLPLPHKEREHKGLYSQDNNTDNGNLKSLFSKWKNPVFARHPTVAVDVSSGQSDTLAVKIHNILYPYRFTKEMMHSLKVIQQVDNKFIACVVDTKKQESSESVEKLLVLVDQHAAHERVRLEQLIADSYEFVTGDNGRKKRLRMSSVIPPLQINVTELQYRLLRVLVGSLLNVGLSLSFPDTPGTPVLVSAVPACFVEKEANEMQRGRSPVIKTLVEYFFFLVLPSGAVKFNDSLTLEDCKHLMKCLAGCSLPFQCAHGRPSILPLADLQHMVPFDQAPAKPNLSKLKKQHKV